MPTAKRSEHGFRHGLRVRIGPHGPKGRLLRCQGRNQPYWRVRLDDGTWAWPDDLVVDGPGDTLEPQCLDCRLPFMGAIGDLICQPCQRAQFGEGDPRTVENVARRHHYYRTRSRS